MGTVIDVRKYMEQKNAQKVEAIKQAAIRNPWNEQRNTGSLSVESLVNEYLKSGKSLLKLAVYIIEQYGYIYYKGEKCVFEEVKRDMKYCEVQPEVSKRLKAHLGVKINGEWKFIEVKYNYSDGFDKKFDVIGNYNIKGYQVQVCDLACTEMKSIVETGNLEEIVKNVHKIVYRGMLDWTSSFDFVTRLISMPDGRDWIDCSYTMLEMHMPDYAILEGTEIKSRQRHLVFFYKEGLENVKDYAKQYREKYAGAGVPLYYSKIPTYDYRAKHLKIREEVCWKRLFQGSLYKKLMP